MELARGHLVAGGPAAIPLSYRVQAGAAGCPRPRRRMTTTVLCNKLPAPEDSCCSCTYRDGRFSMYQRIGVIIGSGGILPILWKIRSMARFIEVKVGNGTPVLINVAHIIAVSPRPGAAGSSVIWTKGVKDGTSKVFYPKMSYEQLKNLINERL